MRLTISAVVVLAVAALAGTAAAQAAAPDPRLLATYEPVMQFDPLERFMPAKIESFLTDAGLEQPSGVVQQNAAPGDLPVNGGWRLDQNGCTPAAPLGGLDCYAAAGDQGGGGPTIYGRVAHENGETILQYWFFYYDDVYSYAYPPSDFIWQAHEGDWEDVSVVLGSDGQPLVVGYSQHCLGQRRDWVDTPRVDDTHPLVHVAIGSHANYFSAGTHPIAVACIPTSALAILSGLKLPLPVDYAFAGPTAGPPGSGGSVLPVEPIADGGPSWLQFPGSWGELQYFHAPAPIGTVAFGTSPVGPAFHAEWIDPLGTLATWPAS
jgi:hypothetical protein